MSCPSGVNILECLEMYNTVYMFDAPEVAKISYNIVLSMLTRNPEFTSQFLELVCVRRIAHKRSSSAIVCWRSLGTLESRRRRKRRKESGESRKLAEACEKE